MITSALPLSWAVHDAPAVATRATASKAAAANTRHVVTGYSFNFGPNAGITAGTKFQIRDGATGAGTVLYEITFPATGAILGQVGLYIPGTVNTAMTIEFDTAPLATGYQSVNMWGYSISV